MKFLPLLLFFPVLLHSQPLTWDQLVRMEKDRVIGAATRYLSESPVTVTAAKAERSAGGLHDYYSEATYWWPNLKDPNGPYIRKDGLTNPENFESHLLALQRLSIHVAGLTAAFVLTNDKVYADKAQEHLRAWFVDGKTRMNPNLLYAQAIKGVVTGRGIGIIDAIHCIEVVKSLMVLEKKKYLSPQDVKPIKEWFREFLGWITTHPYGIDERDNGNNHSTWWAAQVAMYATFVGDEEQKEFCRRFYRGTLLTRQMAKDGSFPEELRRTRPYSYSLFNMEGMALLCEILSDTKSSLWDVTTADGRGMRKAMEFLVPFVKNKKSWTYPKDVAHFDELPVRMQSILFAACAFKKDEYFEVWKSLNADYTGEELIRTFPIHQPILWWK